MATKCNSDSPTDVGHSVSFWHQDFCQEIPVARSGRAKERRAPQKASSTTKGGFAKNTSRCGEWIQEGGATATHADGFSDMGWKMLVSGCDHMCSTPTFDTIAVPFGEETASQLVKNPKGILHA